MTGMKSCFSALFSATTLSIVLLSGGGEVRAETLKQAIQIAVSRAPAIKYAHGMIASADSSIGEARSGWFPTLQVSAGNQLVGNKPDNGDSNQYTATVEQNLFDFGRTGNRVDYAEFNKASEIWKAREEAEVIASKVTEAYLNIIKYERLIENNRQNMREHRRILDVAKARASGGIDNQGDVEQVEVRIKGLEADMASFRAQLEAARQEYEILVGKAPEQLAMPELEFLKPLLSQGLRERISQSPRVQSLQMDKEAAMAEYQYTRKSWLPQFSLSVSQGKSSLYNENDTTVMVNVSSNLFDGGASIFRSQGAASRAEAARWNIEKSVEALATSVTQYYQEALGYQRQAVIYNNRKTHSMEVMALYEEQYKVNRRSVLDLLNAAQEYFQTVSNEISSDFNYCTMLIRALSEIGMINESFKIKLDIELTEKAQEYQVNNVVNKDIKQNHQLLNDLLHQSEQVAEVTQRQRNSVSQSMFKRNKNIGQQHFLLSNNQEKATVNKALSGANNEMESIISDSSDNNNGMNDNLFSFSIGKR